MTDTGGHIRGDVYDRMGRYFATLTAIENKARWYAENDARDPQEVDHALCVEILALAEEAIEGRNA